MQLPTPRSRSLRSIVGPALAVVVTALSWHRWPAPWGLGLLLFAIVALGVAVGLPRVWAPVQAAIDRLAHGLAAAVTWLLLAGVFVLLFIPGRLVLALLRRDPLDRARDPARSTYWEPLASRRPGGGFRRQF
jgi:hypothetical protein